MTYQRAVSLILPILMVASCASLKETDPRLAIISEAGSSFYVVIAANPSTGYHWEIVEESFKGLARFEQKEYKPDAACGRAIGSGGNDVWTFKALTSGKTKICFEQYPPFGRERTMKLEFDLIVR